MVELRGNSSPDHHFLNTITNNDKQRIVHILFLLCKKILKFAIIIINGIWKLLMRIAQFNAMSEQLNDNEQQHLVMQRHDYQSVIYYVYILLYPYLINSGEEFAYETNFHLKLSEFEQKSYTKEIQQLLEQFNLSRSNCNAELDSFGI